MMTTKSKPAVPKTASATHLTHNEIRAVVIGIMLAMFLGALDQTIVATALPTIGRSFNDVASLSWVVTAYLLTATAVTPLYGKLSDIHGRRGLMLTAICIFIVGSIACALAPNMLSLVAARALQGLGGGALMALAQTIIADIVSPRERGRYQGYISAVFATSSIGGPILGGFLTEHVHWSLIFWINLPLGFGAFIMTASALSRVPFHARRRRLDIVGALLMVVASITLLLALTWGGQRYPWLSKEIAGLVAASIAFWSLFAWRLVSTREPFLPLAVLGNAVVRCSTLSGACAMGTLVGMTIFVPLYFEVVLHLSVSQSGLALIPLMGGSVVFSTLVSRGMMYMTHYKRMPLVGLTLAIAALGCLAIWPSETPTPLVLLLLAVVGAGLGSVLPMATICMQNAVAQSQMGVATGAANFFRALFSALVVAILGAIVLGGLGGRAGASVDMLARVASADDLAHVFRFVFITAAVILAFGLAFLIGMEERELRGPAMKQGEPTSAPASPIPQPSKPQKRK